jgi:hypothetical protein
MDTMYEYTLLPYSESITAALVLLYANTVPLDDPPCALWVRRSISVMADT